jgi:DNA-directed RNA polymerase subunit RPC12/RpoP
MDCTRCNVKLQPVGRIPVRVGGKTGVALFFLQEWAELGERIIAFEAYRCPKCGEVVFFDADASLYQELKV